MKKRFSSLLLALVLCIGLLPMAANAAVEQPAIQSTLWDNSGSANGAKPTARKTAITTSTLGSGRASPSSGACWHTPSRLTTAQAAFF